MNFVQPGNEVTWESSRGVRLNEGDVIQLNLTDGNIVPLTFNTYGEIQDVALNYDNVLWDTIKIEGGDEFSSISVKDQYGREWFAADENGLIITGAAYEENENWFADIDFVPSPINGQNVSAFRVVNHVSKQPWVLTIPYSAVIDNGNVNLLLNSQLTNEVLGTSGSNSPFKYEF